MRERHVDSKGDKPVLVERLNRGVGVEGASPKGLLHGKEVLRFGSPFPSLVL